MRFLNLCFAAVPSLFRSPTRLANSLTILGAQRSTLSGDHSGIPETSVFTIRLATLNDGKLAKNGVAIGRITDWLEHSDADVAIVSEGATNCGFEHDPVDPTSRFFISSPAKQTRHLSGGVAMLWSRAVNSCVSQIVNAVIPGLSVSSMRLDNLVTLVGVYIHPGAQISSLKQAVKRISELSGPLVIAGDFNCASPSNLKILEAAMDSIGLRRLSQGSINMVVYGSKHVELESEIYSPRVTLVGHRRLITDLKFKIQKDDLIEESNEDAVTHIISTLDDVAELGSVRPEISPAELAVLHSLTPTEVQQAIDFLLKDPNVFGISKKVTNKEITGAIASGFSTTFSLSGVADAALVSKIQANARSSIAAYPSFGLLGKMDEQRAIGILRVAADTGASLFVASFHIPDLFNKLHPNQLHAELSKILGPELANQISRIVTDRCLHPERSSLLHSSNFSEITNPLLKITNLVVLNKVHQILASHPPFIIQSSRADPRRRRSDMKVPLNAVVWTGGFALLGHTKQELQNKVLAVEHWLGTFGIDLNAENVQATQTPHGFHFDLLVGGEAVEGGQKISVCQGLKMDAARGKVELGTSPFEISKSWYSDKLFMVSPENNSEVLQYLEKVVLPRVFNGAGVAVPEIRRYVAALHPVVSHLSKNTPALAQEMVSRVVEEKVSEFLTGCQDDYWTKVIRTHLKPGSAWFKELRRKFPRLMRKELVVDPNGSMPIVVSNEFLENFTLVTRK